MKDAKGHGSDPRGAAASALAQGHPKSEQVPVHGGMNMPPEQPAFRMNVFTHEIVDPQGNVVGRMNLGKNNGVALDVPSRNLGSIQRNSGTALHDAVAMAAYRASKYGGKGGDFPAEHISTELHYMTAKDFGGHTIRRTPTGGKKYGSLPGE